jgi:hypothetical protein
MGTKVSTSASSNSGANLQVDASLKIPGLFDLGSSVNGGFSTTGSDTTSQTVTKGQELEIKVSGIADGVNHGADMFLLLMNPAVGAQTSVTGAVGGTCGPIVGQWYMGLSGSGTEELYEIYAQYLQDPSTMPSDVAQQLQALHFTTADYQKILSLDPFVNGSTSIDTNRFIPTTWSFPYEPPLSSECTNGVCTCASLSNTVKNELENDVGTSYGTTYTTSATIKASESFLDDIFGLTESATANWGWTSTATSDDITSSTQSATVAVMCPSPSYNGPTEMAVYWDTLFGSFLFVPTVIAPPGLKKIAQGHVTDASGNTVRHQPVQLVVNGKTYHSYTNNAGDYTIYSTVNLATGATGQLTVGSVTQTTALGLSASPQIRLP